MLEINYSDLFKAQDREEKKEEKQMEAAPQEAEAKEKGNAPSHLCLSFSSDFIESVKRQGKSIE